MSEEQEIAYAGAARQAAMLAAGEMSSRELTELHLGRIERLDPRLNAFRVVWAERALAEADAADERLRPRGILRRRPGAEALAERPLLGVPVAIKDTLDVEGDVTTLGTAAFDEPAEADSILVSKLREAGAVILGKTHLPELAIHGYTESKTFGVTRNPWDPSRTPGGSSGGSAAAMAAGMAAIAHASDGAGSIRCPAAHCGLFGLKPQRNRVPIDVSHWHGLSVNGVVSHTVADTALFLDAVTAGPAWSAGAPLDPERPFAESAAGPPPKLRIAVAITAPRAVAPPQLGEDSRRAVSETAELLASLGHAVEWREPDWGLVGTRISARYLGGIAEDIDSLPHPEALEAQTRGYSRIAKAAAPRWAIERALRNETPDRERINAIFEWADVLLTPMTAGPAFEVGRFHGRTALRTLIGESRFYPYAVPWNHTGQPAASVPAGLSSEGLPIAVQLVAPPDGEGTLLSLAAQLEAERPWADRRPAL